jgi:hypothetical protein
MRAVLKAPSITSLRKVDLSAPPEDDRGSAGKSCLGIHRTRRPTFGDCVTVYCFEHFRGPFDVTLQDDMAATYDIFSKLPDPGPVWIARAAGSERARERLLLLSSQSPGTYPLYDFGSRRFIEAFRKLRRRSREIKTAAPANAEQFPAQLQIADAR